MGFRSIRLFKTSTIRFYRSFVPPARDEESATQRKAHAKRARETRRSTQGISLEEIQNAEMLIRKNANSAANEKAQANAVEKPPEDGMSSALSADPIANSGQSQKSVRFWKTIDEGCLIFVTFFLY